MMKLKLQNINNFIHLFEDVLKLVNGKVPIIIELKTDKKSKIRTSYYENIE